MDPLVKNAADEEQVKEAKAKERSKAMADKNDLLALVLSPAFRRFIYPFIEHCDRISFSKLGNDMTNFQEGERNICLKIKGAIIEADPQAYLLILKEAKERGKK